MIKTKGQLTSPNRQLLKTADIDLQCVLNDYQSHTSLLKKLNQMSKVYTPRSTMPRFYKQVLPKL